MRHTRSLGVGNRKLRLLNFLKMLDLVLSQIYKRVFYVWKSIALDNVWVRDSCLFIYFFSPVFSRVYRCAALAISMSAS